MTTDIHQHLWPAPFLSALRARRRPPRLVEWTLELPGDAPYAVDPAAHDVDRRAAAATERLVCVAPSAASRRLAACSSHRLIGGRARLL